MGKEGGNHVLVCQELKKIVKKLEKYVGNENALLAIESIYSAIDWLRGREK
jgi:hypothetical protein